MDGPPLKPHDAFAADCFAQLISGIVIDLDACDLEFGIKQAQCLQIHSDIGPEFYAACDAPRLPESPLEKCAV